MLKPPFLRLFPRVSDFHLGAELFGREVKTVVANRTAHRKFSFDVGGSFGRWGDYGVIQRRMVELSTAMFAANFAGGSHKCVVFYEV